MKDPLEYVARELWEKLGFRWNKTDLAEATPVDDSYKAKILVQNGSLEYTDSLIGWHDEDLFDKPAKLVYIERGMRVSVTSASNIFTFAELKVKNEGKRSLDCSIQKAEYDILTGRVKSAGHLGEQLLQQQRVGNPDIIGYGSWRISLDNFSGLAEFLYNLIAAPKTL